MSKQFIAEMLQHLESLLVDYNEQKLKRGATKKLEWCREHLDAINEAYTEAYKDAEKDVEVLSVH